MSSLRSIYTVFKRELQGYFEAPVAYVFLVVFLVLLGFLTFGVNRFYESGAADLEPFFNWHPVVFLLLVPAATMGLWAEERRSGTIELLLTMPVTLLQTILGKFLAAWLFITMAIVLTFPVVLTTAYLGNPDMGVILCGYVGSILLAGAYVSVGLLTSSLTGSQVISFVLAMVMNLLLLLAGLPAITGFLVRWAPNWMVDGVAAFSVLTHFEAIKRGVVDPRDLVYYASVIVFMLVTTQVVLDNRKSA